jgi:hypothetical protein
MMESLLDDTDVRIVYDSRGNKREVLISQEVQERLEKSNEDVRAGRYLEVNAAEVERALEWLHESTRSNTSGNMKL